MLPLRMANVSACRLPHARRERLVTSLLEWYAGNARDLPWRRTRDPYAVWISEIMLQQTQVATVMPYWERWMQQMPSVAALAKARTAQLHKLWEGLGYYRRVDHLQKAARVIMKEHAGRFPRKFDEILALPGIGRYTAGAICSIAYNLPSPILDGNVIRVLTRIFGIGGDPREKAINRQLWELAEVLVHNSKLKTHDSKLACGQFNQSLMELGAMVCTPRQPACERCPVARLCFASREHRIAEFPTPAFRSAPTARRFAAIVLNRGGRYLVRQRPRGVVNARLWEFPNVELAHGDRDARAAASRLCGFRAHSLKPLCTIKHSITRYHITLDAFQVCMPRGRVRHPDVADSLMRWLPPSRLKALAFPSAHRKILNAIATAPAKEWACISGLDQQRILPVQTRTLKSIRIRKS